MIKLKIDALYESSEEIEILKVLGGI